MSDARVTPGELNIDASTDTQLRSKPRVFINACKSARMSPAFYDGFVPHFMTKGARGVVGTECLTPALFATVWARRFFERFPAGEPPGEVLLGLRQEFLKDHGNPLGLMYAVLCNDAKPVRISAVGSEPAIRKGRLAPASMDARGRSRLDNVPFAVARRFSRRPAYARPHLAGYARRLVLL
jgi:hypothetical protein